MSKRTLQQMSLEFNIDQALVFAEKYDQPYTVFKNPRTGAHSFMRQDAFAAQTGDEALAMAEVNPAGEVKLL